MRRKKILLLLLVTLFMSSTIVFLQYTFLTQQNLLRSNNWFTGLYRYYFYGRPVIAVLLFACDRVTVRRTIDQILQFRGDEPDSVETFPLVVSQDCDHKPTREVIESYREKLSFIQQPDQSDIELHGKAKKMKGYYKIARHYRWALNHTFNVLNYDTILVLEDDLDLSPDIFEYFLALHPILLNDPSLYCISAWNDNGKDRLTEDDPTKLYRSDFFPGLGWMFTRDLWTELADRWPAAYWDDWIRLPEQRRGRACIRPELSRTKTFGKKGVSNGQFFEKHLKYIKLNTRYVPFSLMDLTYLIRPHYDHAFMRQVYSEATLVDIGKLFESISTNNATSSEVEQEEESFRVEYSTLANFKSATKYFGLMNDLKSGVPRTGYLGVVCFMFNGARVYLAPRLPWSGYNLTWV